MSGCLSLPFRILGCLGLILLLVGAWFYRDLLLEEGRKLLGRRTPVEAVGRPTDTGVRRARDKVDSLNAWRADSVVLSAGEMASLVGAGLDPEFRNRVESLSVELGEGRIQLTGSLLTRGIPRETLGPLGDLVGDRARLSAGGTVAVVGPERGEWRVDRLTLGDFPFPRDVIPRLLEQVLGTRTNAIPVAVPEGVKSIRVRPGGVTLYGTGERR